MRVVLELWVVIFLFGPKYTHMHTHTCTHTLSLSLPTGPWYGKEENRKPGEIRIAGEIICFSKLSEMELGRPPSPPGELSR